MRKIAPIVLLVLGLGMLVGGAASAIGQFGSAMGSTSATFTAPGEQSLALESGKWVVYESVGDSDGNTLPATLGPEDIAVSGPGGTLSTVCISCGSYSETLTLGNNTYKGIVSFEAGQPGTYQVAVDGDGQDVRVGRAVGATVAGVFRWVGVAAFGALLAVIGLVWLLVVVIGGRRKAANAVPPATSTPGGAWYPDPQNPQQLRWWDGKEWTDHVSEPGK